MLLLHFHSWVFPKQNMLLWTQQVLTDINIAAYIQATCRRSVSFGYLEIGLELRPSAAYASDLT